MRSDVASILQRFEFENVNRGRGRRTVEEEIVSWAGPLNGFVGLIWAIGP